MVLLLSRVENDCGVFVHGVNTGVPHQAPAPAGCPSLLSHLLIQIIITFSHLPITSVLTLIRIAKSLASLYLICANFHVEFNLD